MKDGSADMWFRVAGKRCSPLGVVSGGCLNQSETAHLEKIILVEARLTGVMACNRANQMQMVLDLTVPMPEMVFVQRMNWIAISSVGAMIRP